MSKARDYKYDLEVEDAGEDLLGWHAAAKRLGHYLTDEAETPLTVGIQGAWGSGKTSFINLIEDSIKQRANDTIGDNGAEPLSLDKHLFKYIIKGKTKADKPRHIYVLHFDSWVFDQSEYSVEDLFPVYIAQVVEEFVADRDHLDTIRGSVSKWLGSRMKAAGASMVELVKLIPYGDIVSKGVEELLKQAAEEQKKLIEELPGSKQRVQDLVNKLLKNDKDNKLIIVVDDLDRIEADKAIKVMEKLKVFFDVSGVIFLLAADLDVLEQGIRQSFGSGAQPGDGKHYLDKIVKVRYNIPPLTVEDLGKIMVRFETFRIALGIERQARSETEQSEIIALLRAFPSVGGNIRTVKLVMLTFEFLYYIADSREGNTSHEKAAAEKASHLLLAIIVLYQYSPDLAQLFYNLLTDAHGKILHLPDSFNGLLDQRTDLAQAHLDQRSDIEDVYKFFNIALRLSGSGKEWLTAFHKASQGLAVGTASN